MYLSTFPFLSTNPYLTPPPIPKTFMRPPRDVYPRALLYPFTECALYSIRFEITKYDGGGLLSPFIYTGVLTEAETETIGTRPGVAPCDTCFKAEQFLGLDSQLLKLSSGFFFFLPFSSSFLLILSTHFNRYCPRFLPQGVKRH